MVRQEQVDPTGHCLRGIREERMMPGTQISLGAWDSSRGQPPASEYSLPSKTFTHFVSNP